MIRYGGIYENQGYFRGKMGGGTPVFGYQHSFIRLVNLSVSIKKGDISDRILDVHLNLQKL